MSGLLLKSVLMSLGIIVVGMVMVLIPAVFDDLPRQFNKLDDGPDWQIISKRKASVLCQCKKSLYLVPPYMVLTRI